MLRRAVFFALVLMVAGSLCWAAPIESAPMIVVGDHDLLENTAGQQIQIYVSGGGNVSGLNLFVQVGDGGPELTDFFLPAGTDGPSITSIDLKPIGGIFAGIGDSQVDITPDVPQVKNSTIAMTGGGSVVADGLLAIITIDTTGFFAGDAVTTWNLLLGGVLPDAGGYDTDFAGTPIDITNGSLSVVAVPEPATLGLIALGGAGLLWRRRKH